MVIKNAHTKKTMGRKKVSDRAAYLRTDWSFFWCARRSSLPWLVNLGEVKPELQVCGGYFFLPAIFRIFHFEAVFFRNL